MLKMQKQIEYWNMKRQVEEAKGNYNIQKLLLKKDEVLAKKGWEVGLQKLKLLKEFEDMKPFVTMPVKGIVGDVAITQGIAIEKGTKIYTFKVEDISNKGVVVNGEGLNIYFAKKDMVSDEFIKQIFSEENVEKPKQLIVRPLMGEQ